ncbi:MAG: ThuA domain-containing protein [Planctomycetales bacterium]|nr:ThuA domain-containing protein [Planctomycetales bacterium]
MTAAFIPTSSGIRSHDTPRLFALIGGVRRRLCLLVMVGICLSAATASGQEKSATKRLLLLGQGPDGHPATTHEYMAGMRILESLLRDIPNLQVSVHQADGEWPEGPELLRDADAAVLFLSQGAKWIHAEPRRLEAFAQLAARGGGLSVLHWGMGTKEAENIGGFLKLFGACHGGPDRRYKVLESPLRLPNPNHPVAKGLSPFEAHDEFYYTLKTIDGGQALTPLIEAHIDDQWYMVAWAWQRGDGGRSFGFSGLHFHRNWKLPEYRRLALQGIVWTAGLPIPEQGLKVEIAAEQLELKP